ncbi:MAG: rhodanese-like domain-containing protein [Pseudomonadota bacterium]
MTQPLRAAPILGSTLAVMLAVSACSKKEDRGDAPSFLAQPALAATGASEEQTASAIRDVSVAQADALISGEEAVVVLDVRTPGEFADGHIGGAVNLDAMSDTFVDDLAKLDKDTAYVVHCRSSKRSARAVAAMKEARFTSVAHMKEGMNGWNEAGLPLAK